MKANVGFLPVIAFALGGWHSPRRTRQPVFSNLAPLCYTLLRDMSPEMLGTMTEAQFSSLHTMLDAKVGNYVSRQVSGVKENDGFITVVYDAQYENKEHVTLRVVFDQDRRVSGRWLDSPKLRQ